MNLAKSACKQTFWIDSLESERLGRIWVVESEKGLAAVHFSTAQETCVAFVSKLAERKRQKAEIHFNEERTAEACNQILDYLVGQHKDFDLPIDWSFMPVFQQLALRATLAIPYGQTTTYQEIAQRIGKPRAARAVGQAEARNPMPLVIPCHRVIGNDGRLHGYGGPGGTDTKAWLLEMERAYA